MYRHCSVVLLAMAVTACGGGGSDPVGDDDVQPGIDAGGGGGPDGSGPDPTDPDAGPPADPCSFDLTPAEACEIAMVGEVTPCSVDPSTGEPSDEGVLEIRRGDGTSGYVCATGWNDTGGAHYADPHLLLDSPDGCCGGTPGAPVAWPATNPDFGTPHGPWYIKPQETTTDAGGAIRANPFAVVLSSPASGAAFQAAKAQWEAWAGDGVAHTGPGGTGAYYFPEWVLINYLVVPTIHGDPVIVLAPEVFRDAALTEPLGHPTVGVCAPSGGAPLAFFGGDLRGTLITNHSGRFSAGSGTTLAHLEHTRDLFNCYGVTVTEVQFQHPDDY